MKRRDFIAPPETVAAIFITPTICEFQHRKDSQFISKQVAPSTLKLAFNDEAVDTDWLPEGVVRWGTTPAGEFAVGYFPQARYKFSVVIGGKSRRLFVPMPALIFAGIGNSYYVWAMKGKGLDPNGALYYAPVPNLNEHGLICFGSNIHPDVRDGGFGPSWRLFLEAPFTDHHSEGRSRFAMKDVREHLVKLSRKRAKVFPPSALIPMNVTLNAAVHRLINRDRSR